MLVPGCISLFRPRYSTIWELPDIGPIPEYEDMETAVPQLSGLSIYTVIWYASVKEAPHLLPRLG